MQHPREVHRFPANLSPGPLERLILNLIILSGERQSRNVRHPAIKPRIFGSGQARDEVRTQRPVTF